MSYDYWNNMQKQRVNAPAVEKKVELRHWLRRTNQIHKKRMRGETWREIIPNISYTLGSPRLCLKQLEKQDTFMVPLKGMYSADYFPRKQGN